MLGDDNQIKLIDFGLALTHRPGYKKLMAGTPRFIAPEMFTDYYD